MKTFTQSTKILVAAAAMIVGASASYADTYDPSTLQSGTNASLLSLVSGHTSNNGAVTITYLGDNLPPELVIPSRINGEPVVRIGDGNGSVTYRGAPDEDYPFETSIIIPDGVKRIERWAFQGCAGLTSIVIPDSVEYIGEGAFEWCTSLTSVKLPAGLKRICERTFSGCQSLESITIPNSVTRIDSGAFSYCRGLVSVTIPDSVTSVGAGVFGNCGSLEVIYLPIIDGGYNYTSDDLSYENNAIISRLLIDFDYNDGAVTIRRIYEDYDRDIDPEYAMYLPPRENFVIPSHIEGNPVKAIDGDGTRVYDAFCREGGYDYNGNYNGYGEYNEQGEYVGNSPEYYCGATSIVIPEGVKRIGGYAFRGCYGLESIVIPDSVTEIGESAFEECTSLTSVKLSAGLKKIECRTFRDCESLEAITIPNRVTRIESEAFSYCHGLTSVVIPDSVTYVEEGAFGNCAFLEVIYVGYNPLYDTSNLTKYYDYNTGSYNNGNTIVSQLEIDYAINGGAVTIKRIREGGIEGEMAMYLPPRPTLVIPSKIDGYPVTGIGDGSGNRVYDAVYYDDDDNGHYGVSYYYGATSIIIPEKVSYIGDRAFAECYGLTSIVIPDSVEYIGVEAFWMCASLTSIKLPAGLKRIHACTFSDCQSLESITIPDSVTRIDSEAFRYCHGLESVTIPDSVTYVGGGAFGNCAFLEVIYVGYNPQYDYDASHLTSCYDDSYNENVIVSRLGIDYSNNGGAATINHIWEDGIEGEMAIYLPPRDSLVIPSWINGYPVTRIGSGNRVYDAVYYDDYDQYSEVYYYGATSIIIPDKVSYIGDYAFQGCYGLESIVIPDSVEYIGMGAFEWCASLTSIKLPAGLKRIYANTFSGCQGLESITIPGSVTRIDDNAFSGCQGLESITIPGSVTRIDDNAFSYCHGLESVIIPDSVRYVGNNVFYHSSGLEKIYVFNRPEYNLARLYEGNDAQAAYATATSPTTAKGVSYAMIDTAIEKNAAFKAVALAHDGSYDSLVRKTAENGQNTIEECLIIGIDPTNEEAKFTTSIEIVDGEPKITYTPDLGQARKYVTMGCAELGGEWKVINSDAEKEGLRFFKVKVAMP